MRVTLFVLTWLSIIQTFAQNTGNQTIDPALDPSYVQGKGLYDQGQLAAAIPFLERTVKQYEKFEDGIYYLGLCYRATNQFDKAIAEFKKLEALRPEYWSWYYYEWGMAYFALGKYDECIPLFEKFEARFPDTPKRKIYFAQSQYKRNYAQQRKALLNEKITMKAPVKLPAPINTKYAEFMPALDPTGTRLYFSSKRYGGIKPETGTEKEGDDDLYYIEKINGKWGEPVLLPEPINSPQNEGAACFSADGQLMVYTACGGDGVGSCDLYISVLEGKQWSKPKNMGNVINSDEWDSQPTISADGNRIIFTSNRKGGYGGEELYMSEKNAFGEWGPAGNLGGIINTPFDEKSPFLSQDGRTLYFTSNGHPGYGGYDLFKSVFENGKWSTPVNLGRPLNTEGDDQYFTIGGSGEVGYFASTREGGELDIFEIEIPEDMRPKPTVVVTGVVTNEKTGEKLSAYVLLEDLNTGELIAANKSNSATGKYLTVLPAGRSYSVSANKDGFFFYSQRIDVPVTTRFQEILKDIHLKPIEKGAKVVLNNIFFETGKAILSPQSHLELEKAVTLMKGNPSMVIEVGGHTDNVGDDASNMRLSLDRARAVRDYLLKAGIPAQRVQAKGYGESYPIATNDTDEGRQSNRRTEFSILEF